MMLRFPCNGSVTIYVPGGKSRTGSAITTAIEGQRRVEEDRGGLWSGLLLAVVLSTVGFWGPLGLAVWWWLH